MAGDQLGLFDGPEEGSGLPDDAIGVMDPEAAGILADEVQALGDEALAAIG